MTRENRPRRQRSDRRATSKRPPSGQRRSVSQHGGRIDSAGDANVAALLVKAWRSIAGEGRRLTHGIHAYPARLHPDVVRFLIEQFSQPGDIVVDPFAGSGTTLVESLALGRRAFGSDVNPIANAIERVKTVRRPGPARRAIEQAASDIANFALRTVRAGWDDEQPTPVELQPFLRSFEPDILRELAILKDGISRVADPETRYALTVVFSSILVRVSNRRAETSDEEREGRAPSGAASRMFRDRAVELGAALADLSREAPKDAPDPLVARADALRLPLRDRCAKLVLTSPPYLGTYDYFGVQELRGSLLGLDLRATQTHEIGSRGSAAAHPASALPRFRDDLVVSFDEVRRVLADDGTFVLIIGDSSVRGRHVDGMRIAEEAVTGAKMRCIAVASETRPRTWGPTRQFERREHLIVVKKA